MSKLQFLRQELRALCAELRAIKSAPAADECQAFRDALRRGLDDAIAADGEVIPGSLDIRVTSPTESP
jgi:predicted DNA-binding transcriptional regulator YafY